MVRSQIENCFFTKMECVQLCLDLKLEIMPGVKEIVDINEKG